MQANINGLFLQNYLNWVLSSLGLNLKEISL